VSIIGFIKSLFEKKTVKTPEEINLEIGLEKWKDMKNVSPTFVYMLLEDNDFNNIAPALIHTDRITLNHILKRAESLGRKEELITFMNKFSNISIQQSNKMKSHIMNNLLDPEYEKYKRGTKGTGMGGLYFGLIMMFFRACQIFCVIGIVSSERNPFFSKLDGELVERQPPFLELVNYFV
jgi:hypothetical protein